MCSLLILFSLGLVFQRVRNAGGIGYFELHVCEVINRGLFRAKFVAFIGKYMLIEGFMIFV